MTEVYISTRFLITAPLSLAMVAAVSSVSSAQNINWRDNIVVNKTTKTQNRANRGNFDFPSLKGNQVQKLSLSDTNCRIRSNRNSRVGTSPIITNECDKRPIFVIPNDIFKGDGFAGPQR